MRSLRQRGGPGAGMSTLKLVVLVGFALTLWLYGAALAGAYMGRLLAVALPF
jgi:hypothetical protein